MKRKRKSPRRHAVKSHIREGYRVSSYTRGKGTGSSPFTSRRKLDKPRSFTVNFTYSNRIGDGESVVVIARNYGDALDEAYEERHDSREPIEIELVDPDIGKALKILAREGGNAVKIGAKYAYAAGKTVGKEAVHAVAESYRRARIRRLIEECYNPDRVKRAMARSELKARYPEIYEMCDFSKGKVSTPAMKQRWVRRTKAYY